MHKSLLAAIAQKTLLSLPMAIFYDMGIATVWALRPFFGLLVYGNNTRYKTSDPVYHFIKYYIFNSLLNSPIIISRPFLK